MRGLPHFLIIGAQKSGTTSLYSYMRQHPQIASASTKEIHFFDGGVEPKPDLYARGVSWYRSHFPLRTDLRNRKTFEASPVYLFNPEAARRIHDLIPGVRMVAVLRNPTERAISHYFHEKGRNREPLPPLEAMQAEETRLAQALESGNYRAGAFVRHSYKGRGLYDQQIRRYLQFFPRSQLLVLSSDELMADPMSVLPALFEFVGVEPGFRPDDLRRKNVRVEREEVPSEVYAYLNDYFARPNAALYATIGRSFGW